LFPNGTINHEVHEGHERIDSGSLRLRSGQASPE